MKLSDHRNPQRNTPYCRILGCHEVFLAIPGIGVQSCCSCSQPLAHRGVTLAQSLQSVAEIQNHTGVRAEHGVLHGVRRKHSRSLSENVVFR